MSTSHAAVLERDRRHRIHAELMILKDMVPACRQQINPQQVVILQATVEYIKSLESSVASLKAQLAAASQAQAQVSAMPIVRVQPASPPYLEDLAHLQSLALAQLAQQARHRSLSPSNPFPHSYAHPHPISAYGSGDPALSPFPDSAKSRQSPWPLPTAASAASHAPVSPARNSFLQPPPFHYESDAAASGLARSASPSAWSTRSRSSAGASVMALDAIVD
eukprot:jgi/Hompol1/2926/HPOL_001489-RA